MRALAERRRRRFPGFARCLHRSGGKGNRAASFLAMRVIRPNDFIKTSTGKTTLNATLGNNQVMIEAIRDFYADTGIAIGMPVSR